MKLKDKLMLLGFPENEVKVYIALLDLGSSTAGKITKKSGINRTNVYDALERLLEKGLATYVIMSNRKYFEATAPDNLINFFEEKEKEISEQKKDAESLITEIKKRRRLDRAPQESTIYKGKKGLKNIAEDIIEEKNTLYVFCAEGNFKEIFTHYFEQWHSKRIKNNLKIKIIYNRKIRGRKRYRLMDMRFNSSIEPNPATTWIYGDKVAIIVWSEQPVATLIRSKDVSTSYRQFFEMIWSNSKRLT
jgi:sugar-specific transcriptional regulator TrmB